MSVNLSKVFRHWMGPVLAAFEDEVFADQDGDTVVLTRKAMAALLDCDKATIDNYIDQRTAMGSDTLALFWANFPAPVVDYALQYLRGLRAKPLGDGDVKHLRQRAVAHLQRATQLVAETVEAAEDGEIRDGEEIELRKGISRAREDLDSLEATLPCAA